MKGQVLRRDFACALLREAGLDHLAKLLDTETLQRSDIEALPVGAHAALMGIMAACGYSDEVLCAMSDILQPRLIERFGQAELEAGELLIN